MKKVYNLWNRTSTVSLLSSGNLFIINFFKKNAFKVNTRVSNGLGPDQNRRSVGPDLVPNCLHRLSADDKSRC